MRESVRKISPETFHEQAAAIEAEVKKLIVGQDAVVRHVLIGMISNEVEKVLHYGGIIARKKQSEGFVWCVWS